jgi:hypothetical protein
MGLMISGIRSKNRERRLLRMWHTHGIQISPLSKAVGVIGPLNAF